MNAAVVTSVVTSNPAILWLSAVCYHVVLTDDGHYIFLNNVGTHLPDYLGVRTWKTAPWAMAWLRQFVATLATWSLRFNPTPFHVRFVVGEV
jgi:hypothetical protein